MASVLVFSLVGCAGGNKEEKKEASGGTGEEVEITITHFNIEEQRDQTADYDGFYTMLEAWQEEHPNVKIDVYKRQPIGSSVLRPTNKS